MLLRRGYRILTKSVSRSYKPECNQFRELLSISCWRLVSSHLNPADIVSREFLLNDLVKNEV